MELKLLKAPDPRDIPLKACQFLKQLGVSTIIELPGKDSSRKRTLVTLSHGNEPSGFQALHQWLREGRRPLVDITVILGGVEAALKEPLFFHRHLPQQRDFNRCFDPPFEDSQGLKAQAVLEKIWRDRPEAIIDMHNTSGATPAFAVSCQAQAKERALAGNFVDTLILSQLRVGALMEAEFPCPVVTVEAGGREDPHSLNTAAEGLERFFLSEDLFAGTRPVSLVTNPLRLELREAELSYADGPCDGDGIVLRRDIESLNFRPLGADEAIGWANRRGLSHLRVKTPSGLSAIDEYFVIRQGQICPRKPMTLFMATKRADIALSDCLFYFVWAQESQAPNSETTSSTVSEVGR